SIFVLYINIGMEQETVVDFFSDSGEYLRNVTVDNVIFGYHEKELKVLLQQPFSVNKWTVTGGYIKRTESIQEAADRIASSRTGLKNLFFQQFGSFGKPERVTDSRFNAKQLSEMIGFEVQPDLWIFDYFVSVAF